MVQLYAYEGNTRYELDLYPSEPIKLNFAIEDIIDISRIESAYSQTFRIPGTQSNSKFFKWWYEMSTIDFDITKVVQAEIHSDGLIFMSGELRLQAAYINKETNNIDLEIIFLGNTRDFATQIAEIYMYQLDLTHLNHELTWKVDGITDGTLEDSWNGNLFNGAIRYVIGDRGYNWSEDGRISGSLGEIVSPDAQHMRSIMANNTQWPLLPTQFVPMIRVKEIVDSIFALTNYNYTDDSFFSDTSTYWPLVQDLYTDGLPEDTAEIVYLEGNIEVGEPQNNLSTGTESKFRFTQEQIDPSDAWSQANDEYTAQYDESALYIQTLLNFSWSGESPQFPGPLTIKMWKTINGIPTIIGSPTTVNPTGVNNTYSFQYDSVLDPINFPPISLDQGEKFYITYEFSGQTERASGNGILSISNAQSEVNIAQLLKKDVLIVDFLRSILTKFRLVMAPVPSEPYKFEIKPFNDYVESGTTLDWTYKLDNNKDIVVKPIFFDQSQDIMFIDDEDTDQANTMYTNQTNKRFGEFLYDGRNELITGRREITTVFAPTPIKLVEDLEGSSNFVIPKFYVHGDEQNEDASHYHLQHLPMRPKPRLLFWNDMTTLNNGRYWYYGIHGLMKHQMTTYPRVTYFTELPNTSTTLNLNWDNIDTNLQNINSLDGESVYERYWKGYIDSLYSKNARQYTAYFVLDSQDLKNFKYSDTIFIEGNYYRVSRIYDAPLDNIASIKVDLIKILN